MAPSLFGTRETTPATIAAATASELGDELTLILQDTKQIRERLEGSMDNMVKDLFSRFEAMCPHKQFDQDVASISETTKNIASRLEGLAPGTQQDMEAIYQRTQDIVRRIDGLARTQDLERILEKLEKPGPLKRLDEYILELKAAVQGSKWPEALAAASAISAYVICSALSKRT
jgi:DNA-directed RNA polymerase subunit F